MKIRRFLELGSAALKTKLTCVLVNLSRFDAYAQSGIQGKRAFVKSCVFLSPAHVNVSFVQIYHLAETMEYDARGCP